MDMAHWPQKPMEEIVLGQVQNTTNSCNNSSSSSKPSSSSLERKIRPEKESAINCPRCNSTNTKFCYYNNYSLSQPRYFCKTCRRYWTEGGSLRNVPVGGGSRKNKRSSSSSSSSKKLPDLVVPPASTAVLYQNPRVVHQDHHGQDLNLGFPCSNDFKTFHELIQVPNFDHHGAKNDMSTSCNDSNTNGSTNLQGVSALEMLTGITTRGMMMNSFMPIPIPDPNSVYSSSMIPIPEFKIPSSLSFSLDNGGGGYGISGGLHESSNGRLLFPFEDLKASNATTTAATTTTNEDHDHQHDRDHNGDSNGFWNGMLGGGSW